MKKVLKIFALSVTYSAATIFLAFAGIQTSSADTYEILSRYGDPSACASGSFPASFTGAFSPLVASKDGDVAFVSALNTQPAASLNIFTSQRQEIACEGTQAPDRPAGESISGLATSSLLFSDAGDLLIQSALRAPGFPSGTGFWSRSSLGFHYIVGTQDLVPGLSDGTKFTSIYDTQFVSKASPNSLPIMFFRSQHLYNGYASSRSQWMGSDPQHLTLLSRMFDPAPGFPSGWTFADINRIAVNSDVSIFYGAVAGTGVTAENNQGIWRRHHSQSQNSWELIARSGDIAPGTSGATFNQLFSPSDPLRLPVTNARGHVAFRALFNSSQGSGLWSDISGSLQVIAKTGDQAPGLAPGVTIASILSDHSDSARQGTVFPLMPAVSLADDDSVLFLVRLAGAGISSSNDTAMYRFKNGSFTLLVRTGEAIPGALPGEVVLGNSVASQMRVNSNGTTVFTVGLAQPNAGYNGGTWVIASPGVPLQIIARPGDTIPNSDGKVLVQVSSASKFELNNLNQFIFSVTFHNPDETTTRYGYLRYDESGALRLLAYDLMPVTTTTSEQITLRSPGAYGQFTGNLPLSDSGGYVFPTQIFTAGNLRSIMVRAHIEPAATQCLSDFTGDGHSTIEDLFAFLQLWFALDSRADFNRDNWVTVQDLFDFLAAWFAGCP